MRIALAAAGLAISLAVNAFAQSPANGSLRDRALRLPAAELVMDARANPEALREEVVEAMRRSVKLPATSDRELAIARTLGQAHSLAWQDSFLERQVARFAAWPVARRAAKVRVDSTRRAGIAAFSSRGAAAAIVIWRRGLVRAMAIDDTAGAAAILGNIGAGLLRDGSLDSAATYLERARELAALAGDKRVEANVIGELAGISQARGDYARARDQYLAAMALRERIGETRGIAADHNNLGTVALHMGAHDEARRQFEAALEINRKNGRDAQAATNLVNLAGLLAADGEYAKAEAFYSDALSIWRSRSMWVDVADALRGLGQLELRRGDYPAARIAFAEALEIFDESGPPSDALAVRRDLAGAMAAAGDLQGALDTLRRAQRIADSTRAPAGVRASITLARADFAFQLNSFADAGRLYGQAEALYRQAGDAGGRAEANQGLGALLLERNDLAHARSLLESALRVQVATGNRRAGALTRLALGRLARDAGDTTVARRQLSRAIAELEELGDPVGSASAFGELAEMAKASGLPVAAESLYQAGLARLERRRAPEIAWSLHAGLASLHADRGRLDAAARELRAAIAALEGPARSLTLAERRAAYRVDKSDAYVQLALIEHARGRPIAALEASERARAREMLDILGRGRITHPPDTAVELVAREQDLRRRIADLWSAADSLESSAAPRRGPDAARAGGSAHEALLRTQEAYAELMLEIRERTPQYASLVSTDIPSWRDVARRLDPDEALVEYVIGESGSLGILITRDTVLSVDLGVGRKELAGLVKFARGIVETSERAVSDPLWRAPHQRLYQYLIAPVEQTGLLRGVSRLVVVPHLELHYLPFAALMTTESAPTFLVERYVISFVPSAAVLLALGERRSSREAAGVAAFAPVPEQLPASRTEIEAIGRVNGGGARLFRGRLASEEAFRREAPKRRTLHLATFGVLNRHNPLFSYVQLAPGDGHDGRLEVHEVFGLQLNAELVVLSACQTALGSSGLADVPPGDDWVGLTRAFLHAGAAQVIATLWPVQDHPTAALMGHAYERLARGNEPALSLAEAQRAMIANQATSHPFYWAGFVLTGRAGQRRLSK